MPCVAMTWAINGYDLCHAAGALLLPTGSAPDFTCLETGGDAGVIEVWLKVTGALAAP